MKACAKCGEQFGCGATSGGCWCSGLTLSRDTLEHLRDKFDSCLCPNCLRDYASADEAETTVDIMPDATGRPCNDHH
jgi:hypothetical protein